MPKPQVHLRPPPDPMIAQRNRLELPQFLDQRFDRLQADARAAQIEVLQAVAVVKLSESERSDFGVDQFKPLQAGQDPPLASHLQQDAIIDERASQADGYDTLLDRREVGAYRLRQPINR